MTTLIEREREVTTAPRRTLAHIPEWILGAFGVLAGLVGSWLYYGPRADGTLWLHNMYWPRWIGFDVAGLHEAWPLSLLLAGGMLLALAFGMYAIKLYRRNGAVTLPLAIHGLLALAAAGGAVTYLLVWIA